MPRDATPSLSAKHQRDLLPRPATEIRALPRRPRPDQLEMGRHHDRDAMLQRLDWAIDNGVLRPEYFRAL